MESVKPERIYISNKEIQLPIFARLPSTAAAGFIYQNRLSDILFVAPIGGVRPLCYSILSG